MGAHLVGEFHLVDEQDTLLVAQEQVGDVDGGVADIVGGTQVGGPGDIVEGGHHDGVGQFGLHLGQDAGHLGVHGLAHDLLVMDEEAVVGACGALRVEGVEGGEVGLELDTVVGELLLHALGLGNRECCAVDGHGDPLGGVFGHPVHEVYGAGAVLLHHREAGALQLVGGLQEVAGIGPYQGVVGGNDGGAVGAVGAPESGEPLAVAPVGGGQFALVGVGARDDYSVDAVLLHEVAKGSEILFLYFLHSYFDLRIFHEQMGMGLRRFALLTAFSLLRGLKPC